VIFDRVRGRSCGSEIAFTFDRTDAERIVEALNRSEAFKAKLDELIEAAVAQAVEP
jgi:hypothetical protein